MSLKFVIGSLLVCLCSIQVFAQKLEWNFPGQPHSQLLSSFSNADSLETSIVKLSDSYQILPKFARENPTGYTFLCRMELKGEDRLKMPIWIKVEDLNSYSSPSFPHTYVRVKLLRF